MSRAIASVGFSPSRWNGARKTPNFMPRCAIRVSSARRPHYPAPIAARNHSLESKGQPTMIHVLAIITAKPGKREEVLAAFRANMPAVHAEQGCIEYGPAIDAEGGGGAKHGPDNFFVSRE